MPTFLNKMHDKYLRKVKYSVVESTLHDDIALECKLLMLNILFNDFDTG